MYAHGAVVEVISRRMCALMLPHYFKRITCSGGHVLNTHTTLETPVDVTIVIVILIIVRIESIMETHTCHKHSAGGHVCVNELCCK